MPWAQEAQERRLSVLHGESMNGYVQDERYAAGAGRAGAASLSFARRIDEPYFAAEHKDARHQAPPICAAQQCATQSLSSLRKIPLLPLSSWPRSDYQPAPGFTRQAGNLHQRATAIWHRDSGGLTQP
jgi:hypothetical protein